MITRFVVLRKVDSHSTVIFRADSPAITNIYDVNIVVHCHDEVSATARFAVLKLLSGLIFIENFVDIVIIAHLGAFHNSLVYVHREIWLHNDLIMKMLFQVLSALVSTMTIIYREYLNFGPLFIGNFWLLCGWLNDVKNNSNTIFIGFPDETNMCVGCERPYNSEPFIACF